MFRRVANVRVFRKRTLASNIPVKSAITATGHDLPRAEKLRPARSVSMSSCSHYASLMAKRWLGTMLAGEAETAAQGDPRNAPSTVPLATALGALAALI